VTVVLYARCSTDEQARSGLGLEAQEVALRAEAARRGWADVSLVVDDGVSGAVEPSRRPALGPALLSARRGDVLAVSRLDRCSRNLRHFLNLWHDLERRGVDVVALDVGLDTSTAAGRAMVQMMMVFSELERGLNVERTRAAYAVKLRDGWRPANRVCEADERRVLALRAQGLSERAIAARLSDEDGRRWHRATVTRVLLRSQSYMQSDQ